MKKKILIFVILPVLMILIVKVRECVILKKVYESFDKIKNQTNRFYSVTTNIENNMQSEEKRYLKDDIEKYVLRNKAVGEYCEVKNNKNSEVVAYNMSRKIKYEAEMLQGISELEKYLMGMINLLSQIYEDGKIELLEIFKIHYIIPTTYDGKACYKISTNSEVVIIDKDTYLPVYSSVKIANSDYGDINVEYTYKFEVGTVTDEDVALPDFSDYKIE